MVRRRRRERYEAEPVYRTGYQTSGKCGVPGVAIDGDPNTGVPAYSSWACRSCYTGWEQWGGTSIGTPIYAGVFAIANAGRVSIACTAETGYDFVTGVGSPVANILIAALEKAS